VITPDGYIITNAHVVEDDTTDLKAIFSSDTEKKIPLKFVRMNKAIDLALLKLDTTNLVPLKFAANDQIEVGADVYAIGTPADTDFGQTVTRGIISGKRKFGGHQRIQTDVAISPGNSGGALIRANGILCGIVTSALDGREINDIGFAIPSPIIESSLKINLSE
jgi:serine protease Do